MSAALERVMRALEVGIELSTTTLALEIQGQLKSAPPLGTPIKTGFARNKWDITDDPSGGGISARVTAGGVSVAQTRVGDVGPVSFSPVAGAGGGGGSSGRFRTVYVVNSAPYIGRLNDGHSKQQPAGFVQRAIVNSIKVADVKLGNLDRKLR